jgi:hypothetical protein
LALNVRFVSVPGSVELSGHTLGDIPGHTLTHSFPVRELLCTILKIILKVI